MVKARATSQLAFTFDLPRPATHPAALAGMDVRIAKMVGEVLATAHANGKPREIIAAEMSVLLAETVTDKMLNAWSAPAKGNHNISFTRMCALIAVTNRFDLLDRELRPIGAAVVVGDEIMTVRAGHLRTVVRRAQAELRELERVAPGIGEDRGEC